MVDFIILGGGWASAVFALELKHNFPNAEVVVLEKSNVLGGLLRSIRINNHVFDIGGSHVIFSRNKNMLNKMLSLISKNFVFFSLSPPYFYHSILYYTPYLLSIK